MPTPTIILIGLTIGLLFALLSYWRRYFKPKSLFYQTLVLLTKTLLILQFISLLAFAYYMLIPLLQRSTHDLARVIISTTQAWEAAQPNEQQALAKNFSHNFDIILSSHNEPYPLSHQFLPFIYFLSDSIESTSAYKTTVRENTDQQNNAYIWLDIQTPDNTLSFGFTSQRIGVNKLNIFIIIFIASMALTLLTAIILTRRLSTPLSTLSAATQSISQGHFPKPIVEKGSTELISLTQQFNKMSVRVQELLANRTTLLAGISHDLRTPLTQIQLALSMLPNKGGDEQLMASIQQDLNEINQLIEEVLDIGLTLSEGQKEDVDIENELKNIMHSLNNRNYPIQLQTVHLAHKIFKLYPLALRRVLKNLISNAMHYGNQNPINIRCEQHNNTLTITIDDQGDGIPQDELENVFQPFYRLEKSRNSSTGGSGLGLALVRQLVELHGWHINLQPNQPQGLSATLSIPL